MRGQIVQDVMKSITVGKSMKNVIYKLKCWIQGHILDNDHFCWRCGATLPTKEKVEGE